MFKKSYRKLTHSPLALYNTFNNTYFQYFENHSVKYAKTIDPNLESYLNWFIQTNYIKFHESLDEFREFLIWIFQKNGRVGIKIIHKFIKDWENNKTLGSESFSTRISKYLRNNYITWEEYIAPQKTYFPIILQHYISTRDFPFELILHLNILDNVARLEKPLIKVLLTKEYYDMKKYKLKAEKNKKFLDNEIENIKKSI